MQINGFYWDIHTYIYLYVCVCVSLHFVPTSPIHYLLLFLLYFFVHVWYVPHVGLCMVHIYLYVWHIMNVGSYVSCCMCGSQRTAFRSQFSPIHVGCEPAVCCVFCSRMYPASWTLSFSGVLPSSLLISLRSAGVPNACYHIQVYLWVLRIQA